MAGGWVVVVGVEGVLGSLGAAMVDGTLGVLYEQETLLKKGAGII